MANRMANLFEIAPDLCWKEEVRLGMGCCNITKQSIADMLIEGPAEGIINEKRKTYLNGHNSESNCLYHDMESGCVLPPEYRSPVCLSHYCKGILIDFKSTFNYFGGIMHAVLEGHPNPSKGIYMPEENWVFVTDLLHKAGEMERIALRRI